MITMKKFFLGLIVVPAVGLNFSGALAHSGHRLSGADGSSLFHYLAEPVHSLPILGLVIGVILMQRVSRGLRRRTTRH